MSKKAETLRHKYRIKNKKDTPIFIYTNGKVGSSTVYNSLKKLNNHPIYHLHYLNSDYLNDYEEFAKKNYFNKPNRSPHLYKALLWQSQFVGQQFINKEKIKAITIWRDPIAKNISTFFQWIHFSEYDDHYHFHSHQYDMQFDITTPKNDLSLLIAEFKNHFPHKTHERWLKQEQEEVMGFPYLQYAFDQDSQYQILENDNWQLLTLKLESFSNPDYEKVIGNFVGINNFNFSPANLTENKPKNVPYQQFIEQIEFSPEYLDQLYQSEFMTHFYSADEIQKFRKKWSASKSV